MPPTPGCPAASAKPPVRGRGKEEAAWQRNGVLDHAPGHQQGVARRDGDKADQDYGNEAPPRSSAGARERARKEEHRHRERQREERVGDPDRGDDGGALLHHEGEEACEARLDVEEKREVRDRECAAAQDRANLDQVIGPIVTDHKRWGQRASLPVSLWRGIDPRHLPASSRTNVCRPSHGLSNGCLRHRRRPAQPSRVEVAR